MSDNPSYQEWLIKAKNDLRAAEAILGYYEEPPTDTVCYHSHQVAEKSLKAFTIFKTNEHVWTHDLIVLLNECIQLDPAFENLRERIENLNKYYIETKYLADIPLLFPVEEAEKAKEDAKTVFDFVQNKIASQIE